MTPNPYQAPREVGYKEHRDQRPADWWLRDKLRLLGVALAVIVFVFGPIYGILYWLVGP
jgi:hypothetical protein